MHSTYRYIKSFSWITMGSKTCSWVTTSSNCHSLPSFSQRGWNKLQFIPPTKCTLKFRTTLNWSSRNIACVSPYFLCWQANVLCLMDIFCLFAFGISRVITQNAEARCGCQIASVQRWGRSAGSASSPAERHRNPRHTHRGCGISQCWFYTSWNGIWSSSSKDPTNDAVKNVLNESFEMS